MAKEDMELLQRLAPNNPVDVDMILSTRQQLQQIEQAGVNTHREYSIERPLGRLVQVGVARTLANVGGVGHR